ncbi:MAG: flagellin [Thermodesulfobacteriota bacterium]
MALTINSDAGSSFAAGQLRESDRKLLSALEKIGSGRRINRAADDAAGLTIADGLTSQANSFGQAIRNASDSIAMAEIAGGALGQTTELIQTIRQKALQAANASQNAESRQALQADIDKALAQADSIAQNTTYNGQPLLAGTFSGKTIQVGAGAGETVRLSIGSAAAGQLGSEKTGFLSSVNVLTEEGAQRAIQITDEALAQVDRMQGGIGSTQNQLKSTINNLATNELNTLAAASTIQDVDLAEEAMNFASMKVLTEVKAFALTQTKNMNSRNVLSLLQG